MKKIVGIFVCMLLITTILPITAMAGDENDPEINDVTGDARSYLDIEKAWFYENENNPDLLYSTIKIVKPSTFPAKQHLVVDWRMNGEYYASMLAVGYDIGIDIPWIYYSAIKGRGAFGDPKPIISQIEGYFNEKDGTITCIIPKSTIGNPKPGDVLTNTFSQCFQRFGFWGRLGFYSPFRYMIFNNILERLQVEDTAPDIGYGSDYIIQY